MIETRVACLAVIGDLDFVVDAGPISLPPGQPALQHMDDSIRVNYLVYMLRKLIKIVKRRLMFVRLEIARIRF